MASSYDPHNPIETVNGHYVPCPSAPNGYQWSLQDVSSPDAGRTEDGKMHKYRLAQKVKLQLSWNNIKTEEVTEILNAFDPEYIEVKYLDPKAGGYVTKQFYVGDRSTPMYSSILGLWSNVAFNIIEV